MLLCLGGSLLVAACSRDRERTRATETPTPTLFAATPTAAAIARPPQTPQTSDPPAIRGRAEAFLRRIAPTDADLPAGFAPRPPAVLDGAVTGPPGAAPVLGYRSAFDGPSAGAAPSGGRAEGVTHMGYAYSDPATARQGCDERIAELGAIAQGALTMPNPTVMQADGLQLGDRAATWRAGDPAGTGPVAWALAVQRGAACFTLVVAGTGTAPETLARDLAQRLDQRTAAALQAGAWP